MTDSDSDESPPRPPRGKAPALSKPFSLDSIREIEAGLGNVTRAADYPMARNQGSPERSARANTITAGRAPAIPRVVEPEQASRPRPRPRPRATTSPPTGPPPFAPSSCSSSRQPNRPQFLEVPRSRQAPHQAQPRYIPFPPQQRPSPSQPPPQPLAPAQFRPPSRPGPNQPATTAAIRGPPAASRSPPSPQARPAAAVAAGPSRSPGYGAGDPTIPNNPYGYLPAPPLRHNWNTPNRGAARGARIPRGWTSGRSGRPLDPPLASRPRPQAATTWFNQSPERSTTSTIQEETEMAMSSLALGPGPRDGREDRSTFVRANTGMSRGSLSGLDAGADARYQQRSNTPYTPDLSNPSTTSTPRTGTLDTPMSASALPVWGEEYQYFSPEEAAVVLQSNRPMTIYIDRGSDNPVIPTESMPIPLKEADEESEDDFS